MSIFSFIKNTNLNLQPKQKYKKNSLYIYQNTTFPSPAFSQILLSSSLKIPSCIYKKQNLIQPLNMTYDENENTKILSKNEIYNTNTYKNVNFYKITQNIRNGFTPLKI